MHGNDVYTIFRTQPDNSRDDLSKEMANAKTHQIARRLSREEQAILEMKEDEDSKRLVEICKASRRFNKSVRDVTGEWN
ncbi:MAG: hypothetical protein Q9186_000065 [Xanthomendoza sp. 1 TL-2023]